MTMGKDLPLINSEIVKVKKAKNNNMLLSAFAEAYGIIYIMRIIETAINEKGIADGIAYGVATAFGFYIFASRINDIHNNQLTLNGLYENQAVLQRTNRKNNHKKN
jgi:hypothetical protein